MKKPRRPNTDKMRRNVARSIPDTTRRIFANTMMLQSEETQAYHDWVAYWREQWDRKYPHGYTMCAYVEEPKDMADFAVTIVLYVQRRTDEYTTVRPGSRRFNHYLVR